LNLFPLRASGTFGVPGRERPGPFIKKTRRGNIEGASLRDAFHIAFIGFGEVGQRFSRDLLKNAGLSIRTYDILFNAHDENKNLSDRAKAIGVAPCANAAEAIKGADVVISAVTADVSGNAAADAAQLIAKDQIFFDINSASPETKRRSAASIVNAGGAFVEGAVMAPVLKPGIRVPILAGGPAAERLAARLNGFGMNIESVAPDYGMASAIKLCRSIVIKGMEALMLDCAAACRAWGASARVFASLGETFPSIDWAKLADTMAERVEVHGVRRAAEMREAAEMLAAAGLDPSLAFAVADAQSRGARTI
jgi:3-hydroxyisobutyrate dehydrogenase-like beta-hydroxyacid dehydrogenase